MTDTPTISDSELNAYIDGELDDKTLTEVELWLAEHPEDAAKVHTYKLQKLQLHRLYDDGLDAPVPDAVDRMIAEQRRAAWIPGWRQMAAGIVLLIAGGLGGWGATFLGGPSATAEAGNAFVHRALNAHVVYAHDVVRPVEISGEDENHLVNWLSERLGNKLMRPNLADAGFKLIGGRLVNDEDVPAAMFMYEDSRKRRVTLYVRPQMKGGDDRFRFVAEHGMVSFYWTNGPLTYALSGEMPQQEVLDLAQMVAKDINSRSS